MVPLSLVSVFCFHAYIFPHFLIFSLNSTAEFWQHGTPPARIPATGSLQECWISDQNLNLPKCIFLSVLRMETFLSSNVMINGQFLTSDASLLGSVPPHLTHNAMPSRGSLFPVFMVIPPSAILSSTFSSQTYLLQTVSGTDFFLQSALDFRQKLIPSFQVL